MNEARLTTLRTYYESLSDEALLAEAGLGRDAFAPEAWTIVSEQIERRDLRLTGTPHEGVSTHPDGVAASHGSRVARLAARIDSLPPTIRPAAFGALLIVFFAMARGAWLVLPLGLIYLFATSAHPWPSLMTGVGIAVLAMAGGGLSGLAYGLVGRHVRSAFRGGYYMAGILTMAPYMVALTLIVRVSEGEPLWRRMTGSELAMSGVMTLLFGLGLGRAWFGPNDDGARGAPAD